MLRPGVPMLLKSLLVGTSEMIHPHQNLPRHSLPGTSSALRNIGHSWSRAAKQRESLCGMHPNVGLDRFAHDMGLGHAWASDFGRFSEQLIFDSDGSFHGPSCIWFDVIMHHFPHVLPISPGGETIAASVR